MFTLPSLTTIKYTAAGVAVLAIAAGGFYAGFRWEKGTYEELVAAQAKLQTAAVQAAATDQKRRDDITLSATIAAAQGQTVIVDHYHTITKEIPSHVPDSPVCVPFGLVRVLNAAAGPAAYPVPGAESASDESCAPVSWRSLAADITADYQAGTQNSRQLSDLQWWVDAQAAR